MSNTSHSDSKPDISIIIPALNEERSLSSLIEKLQALLDRANLEAEILIIDDCSDDNTFQKGQELEKRFPNVKTFTKPLPRGMGYAVRCGIDHAKGKIGIIVMGDGVDPVDRIPLFKKKINEEGYDLVLLSRYLYRDDYRGIPFRYKFFHGGYVFLHKNLLGIDFTDLTYGFRAFKLDFIRTLGLKSGGFELSAEMSIKACLKHARVCNVPGRQSRRLHDSSKFSFLRHGPGYARVMMNAIMAKVFGIKF